MGALRDRFNQFVSGDLVNADAAIEMAERLLSGTQAELVAVRQEHAELEGKIVTEGTSPEAVERLDFLERRMGILAPIADKQQQRVEAAHQHKEHVVNAREFEKLTKERQSLVRSLESHISAQKRYLPKIIAALSDLKEHTERLYDEGDKIAKLTGSTGALADHDTINALIRDAALTNGLGEVFGIFQGGSRHLDNETGQWVDDTPAIPRLEDAFAALTEDAKRRYGVALGLIEDAPVEPEWIEDETIVTDEPDYEAERRAHEQLERDRLNAGRAVLNPGETRAELDLADGGKETVEKGELLDNFTRTRGVA